MQTNDPKITLSSKCHHKLYQKLIWVDFLTINAKKSRALPSNS